MKIAFILASAMLAAHGCDQVPTLGGGTGGSTSTSGGVGGAISSSTTSGGVGGAISSSTTSGGFGGAISTTTSSTGAMPCQPDGAACATGSDCCSASCVGGLCQPVAPSSCDDGLMDGAESDVDCGGPACAPCAVGKVCSASADCTSGECVGGLCKPTGSLACSDGMKNGTETDKDCGGPLCASCGVGGTCSIDADCSSGPCMAGVCQMAAPSACNDGIKNGTETDKDCGGPACSPCNPGGTCLKAADCNFLVCTSGFCGVSLNNCGDGIKDGTETDKDCGGPACIFLCGAGKGCAVNTDCSSNLCTAQVCQ